MTEQPPTLAPRPEHSPDQSRPAQGWAPAPLSDGGRASFASRNAADTTPTAPAGRGAAIDRFAPGRSLLPVLAVIVAIIAAGAIFYTTTRPQALPAASASPSHSATPKPTPRPGKRFSADRSHASGTWQVTESHWSSSGLDAYIEVTLDSGSLLPSFDAMPNSGAGYVPGEASDRQPGFDDSAIRPGTTHGGWLFFPTTRETTLIFLGDANDPQISGIEVAA